MRDQQPQVKTTHEGLQQKYEELLEEALDLNVDYNESEQELAEIEDREASGESKLDDMAMRYKLIEEIPNIYDPLLERIEILKKIGLNDINKINKDIKSILVSKEISNEQKHKEFVKSALETLNKNGYQAEEFENKYLGGVKSLKIKKGGITFEVSPIMEEGVLEYGTIVEGSPIIFLTALSDDSDSKKTAFFHNSWETVPEDKQAQKEIDNIIALLS
ncbi:hypothetical protein A3A09_02095 [Candidatus Nomurabacteria bacterium RIFCSPLOWO2_01_FULL_42_20]|nr:MAG: hypothetical protein A3A09_02095 [Candidatus Nomurabacteria bacterium RIFCSPLOWO2_01_FULL_42_20]